LIVDTKWLESHFEDPDQVLIDGRGRFAYNMGHIKKAVPLELEEIINVAENGANLAIEGTMAEKLFGKLGIDESKRVIVYGEYLDPSAARIVWTLLYNGHGNCSLLDRGFKTIKQEKILPIDRIPYEPAATHFVSKIKDHLRADEKTVKEKLTEKDAVIIDCRTRLEHIQARIVGSKLHSWENGIGRDGRTMKSNDELLNDFTASGILKNKSIICYCHSGTRASHKFLQFKYAGFEDVRCYDGSIIDWAQRKNPIRPN
jgi:thiosulfate/3-mercaptopyruvate sulfurtransferase